MRPGSCLWALSRPASNGPVHRINTSLTQYSTDFQSITVAKAWHTRRSSGQQASSTPGVQRTTKDCGCGLLRPGTQKTQCRTPSASWVKNTSLSGFVGCATGLCSRVSERPGIALPRDHGWQQHCRGSQTAPHESRTPACTSNFHACVVLEEIGLGSSAPQRAAAGRQVLCTTPGAAHRERVGTMT